MDILKIEIFSRSKNEHIRIETLFLKKVWKISYHNSTHIAIIIILLTTILTTLKSQNNYHDSLMYLVHCLHFSKYRPGNCFTKNVMYYLRFENYYLFSKLNEMMYFLSELVFNCES